MSVHYSADPLSRNMTVGSGVWRGGWGGGMHARWSPGPGDRAWMRLKKTEMVVLPYSQVGCILRLNRPDSPTHFCCGGRVALSASGLQGRYKM